MEQCYPFERFDAYAAQAVAIRFRNRVVLASGPTDRYAQLVRVHNATDGGLERQPGSRDAFAVGPSGGRALADRPSSAVPPVEAPDHRSGWPTTTDAQRPTCTQELRLDLMHGDEGHIRLTR